MTQELKGFAERGTGDLNHPFERPVHLQDQKDRAGHGQCADEKNRKNRCIRGGEQAKADEEDEEPARTALGGSSASPQSTASALAPVRR
jgi:hypothetical protein